MTQHFTFARGCGNQERIPMQVEQAQKTPTPEAARGQNLCHGIHGRIDDEFDGSDAGALVPKEDFPWHGRILAHLRKVRIFSSDDGMFGPCVTSSKQS
jgi:hypothetical protein